MCSAAEGHTICYQSHKVRPDPLSNLYPHEISMYRIFSSKIGDLVLRYTCISEVTSLLL